MSETGIENEARYKRAETRRAAASEVLMFVIAYSLAVAVLLLDLLVWRPN